jgi:hypothetical protein
LEHCRPWPMLAAEDWSGRRNYPAVILKSAWTGK